MLIAAYCVIALMAVAGIIPSWSLVSLLTLPLAHKTIMTARANYDNTEGLKPAMAGTIAIHLLVGVGLSFGYLITGITA